MVTWTNVQWVYIAAVFHSCMYTILLNSGLTNILVPINHLHTQIHEGIRLCYRNPGVIILARL